jgi:hypothetical protein
MRPDLVLPVEGIPANVNGKVDQDALIRTWQALSDGGREIVAPADDLESSLVKIYSRVLGTEEVSALDSFIQLGGHSLLAFQLLDACLEDLHVNPDVSTLLTGTLRDVAASIRVTRSQAGSSA